MQAWMDTTRHVCIKVVTVIAVLMMHIHGSNGDRWNGGALKSKSSRLNYIVGTAQGDSSVVGSIRGGVFINSTQEDDYIQLLQGDDTDVHGLQGDDRIVKAGGGGSEFHGGPGNDTIIGGTSDDRFFFGDDDEDYVNTRSGNDGHIYGNSGNDVIKLGEGDDFDAFGGAGDDVIMAGPGNDVNIHGGPGDDNIYGGPGDDRLAGDGGSDVINPGKGDDTFGDSSSSGVDTIVLGSEDGHDTALAFKSSGSEFDTFGIQPNEDIIVIPCNASVSLEEQPAGTLLRVDNTTVFMQQVVGVTLSNFTFKSPEGCQPRFPAEPQQAKPLVSAAGKVEVSLCGIQFAAVATMIIFWWR